jgi:hypothetical protein
MFPPSMEMFESDPFWTVGRTDSGRKDPHLPTVYHRLKYGKNMPQYHQIIGNPGFDIINCYAMAACHRVLTDKLSVDDAVTEANNKWTAAYNSYASQMK